MSIFHTLDLPGLDRFTGTGLPRSLAWRIGAEWTALARHATPGPDWPPYDQESRPSLVLGTPSVQESAQLIKEDDD